MKGVSHSIIILYAQSSYKRILSTGNRFLKEEHLPVFRFRFRPMSNLTWINRYFGIKKDLRETETTSLNGNSKPSARKRPAENGLILTFLNNSFSLITMKYSLVRRFLQEKLSAFLHDRSQFLPRSTDYFDYGINFATRFLYFYSGSPNPIPEIQQKIGKGPGISPSLFQQVSNRRTRLFNFS